MSEANRAKIRYSIESAWGETPATPATTSLRYTGESLVHTKGTTQSQTIRSDRQVDNLLEIDQSAEGGLDFEFAAEEYNDFLSNAMRSTISSTKNSHASATIAASSITMAAGNFNTNLEAGQWIKITGGTNDGVVTQIASLTSTVLTCVGTTLAAQAGVSTSVIGRTLKNGTTKTSFFMEVDFEDISMVKYFTGMKVNEFGMDVTSESIVTSNFGFMGKRGFIASASVASTVVASAGTTTPMTAAVNVGRILENGAVLSDDVQAVSFTLNNNMRKRPVVGSKTGADPADGTLSVTGSLNLYLANVTMANKFVDHTETEISWMLRDAEGNVVAVTMPAVKFSEGNPPVPGIDQDVFLPLEFTAYRDATAGYTIRIDMLPV